MLTNNNKLRKLTAILLVVIFTTSAFTVTAGAKDTTKNNTGTKGYVSIVEDDTEETTDKSENETDTTTETAATEPSETAAEYTVEPTTEKTEPTSYTTTVTTESVASTTIAPTTEPTAAPKITVFKVKDGKTLPIEIYVKGKARISSYIKIENKKGVTTYVSKDKKIAKVTDSGIVKGVKKGTARITIKNNNKTKTIKVKVKNPKLVKDGGTEKSAALKKFTVTEGEKYKFTVIGRAAGQKNKYTSSKYAKISTKSKTAKAITVKGIKSTNGKYKKISVKVNGVKLTIEVKVKKDKTKAGSFKVDGKKVKYSVTFKKNINSIKLICGSFSKNTEKFYTFKVKDNIDNLLIDERKAKDFWGAVHKNEAFMDKAYKKLDSLVGEPSISIKDDKVAKIKNGYLYPLSAGKTTLTIKLKNRSLNIDVIVTKPKTIKHLGKTSVVVYNVDECYNLLKDAFYNYIIKGDYPMYNGQTYKYITCYFGWKKSEYDNGLWTKLRAKAIAERDNGQNFHYYLKTIVGLGEVLIPLFNEDEGNVIDITWHIDGKNSAYKKMYKDLYNMVTTKLKNAKIEKCQNNYEKLKKVNELVLDFPIDHKSTDDIESFGATSVFLYKTGVCMDYADATIYVCTLLNIPCYYTASKEHAWTLVEYNGQWYHVDMYWNELFKGSKDVSHKDDDHKIEYIVGNTVKNLNIAEYGVEQSK